MSVGIFDFESIKPLAWAGLTGTFWTVHTHIIIATWIAMAILVGMCLAVRWAMQTNTHFPVYAAERAMLACINMCKDGLGKQYARYVCFIASLFLFTFACCAVGNIPFVEEASRDLNTTLALALSSFCFVQYHKIRVLGIGGFLREFIEPFFLLAPIHLIGEIAKIASMSFRLFGNVLGSGIILSMVITVTSLYAKQFMWFAAITAICWYVADSIGITQQYHFVRLTFRVLFGLMFALTWLQLVLGFAEGLLQAFVLTMLTTTYLSMGITSHHGSSPDSAKSPIEET